MTDTTIATSTASASTKTYHVHVETRAEQHRRRSNEYADRAVEVGAAGREELAAIYAELADGAAQLAGIQDALDRLVT